MLTDIHESYQQTSNLADLNPLPRDCLLLEEFGITPEGIKGLSVEEYIGMCMMLA